MYRIFVATKFCVRYKVSTNVATTALAPQVIHPQEMKTELSRI
jgi:hypothetical protein